MRQSPDRTDLLALVLALGSSWLGCGAPSGDSAGGGESAGGAQVDVQVVSPVRRDVRRQIELPVSVEAFETTTLLSKVSGYLSRIEVDIGDSVREGQVIASIEVPEIADELVEAEAELDAKRADHAAAQAELERAEADFGFREITFQRIKAVREDEPDTMPQQTLDDARAQFELARAAVKAGESRLQQIESQQRQVRAAIKRLETLIGYSEIRAPFNGTVTQRHVDPGTLLQAATSSQAVQRIITVASMDRVRIRFDVSESEVPFLDIGDPAVVTVDALPERKFEGGVTRYAAALEPTTRTMRTEIEMANKDRALRPGMFGRVTVSLDTRTDAITVPARAIRVEGASPFVFCVVDGTARRVDVEATVGDGATVEVTHGLKGDELVVVSARGPISDGAAVNTSASGSEQTQ